MADEKPNIMPTPEQVAAHNSQTAQKLAAQDIMGKGTGVPDNLEAGKNLDALMQEAEKSKNEPPVVEASPEKKVEPTPEEVAKAAEAAKAETERQEAAKRADEMFK